MEILRSLWDQLTYTNVLTIVSFFGSAASVVALMQSVFIMRRLKQYENAYTLKGVMPTYIEKLRTHIKNLKAHQTRRESQRFGNQLSRSIALLTQLESFRGTFPNGILHFLNDQVPVIRAAWRDDQENLLDRAGEIIQQLEYLHETMDNWQLEAPWRNTNV